MSTRHTAGVLAFLFLLCGVCAEAQYIFALPGSNGSTSTATVATANPFGPAGSFFASATASIALETPGNKFYVISNSGSNTVIAVDNSFSIPRSIASLGQSASAAIITPDGRKLFVVAGALYGFDTTSDTPLFGGSGSIPNALDVAATLDGSKILVLANSITGSTLSAVDPAVGQSTASVNLPAFSTGVAVAPNGLAYVSMQNGVAEIDPRSLTIRTQIQVSGRPGKLVFTADGKTGLAVNQTPFTGAALFGFDLVNRAPGVSVPLSSFGNVSSLDKVFPVSNSRALVLSSLGQTLFDVSLNPPAATVFSQSGIGGASAAAISNDLTVSFHPLTQFVYYASAGNLYRYDLSANAPSGQVSLAGAAGALSFVTGANTGTPAGILTYGDNQAVAPSATTLPLVIRVVDAQGKPVANVPVTFQAPGATLQTSSATTTTDGFAMTSLTAPATNGAVSVSAIAGNVSASFTVNVGGTPSGGGGGQAGLTIIAGQGQLLSDNSFTSFSGSSLIVQQKDAAGNPVANSPITYTVTQGVGGLFGGSPTIVFTDTNGMAKADYSAGLAQAFPGFSLGTITASDSAGDTVTFYVTTVSSAANTGGATSQLVQPAFGQPVTGQAGQIVKGAVVAQVVSNSGQAIPNVSIYFTNPIDATQPAGAGCAGTPLSDATGTITCDLKLGGTVGTFQVIPTVGYYQTLRPITVTVTPGPPGIIQIIQGNNQTGTPGQRLPLALLIQVTDAFGNVLAGAPVTWKAATPGVTISNIVATTDQNGRASVLATLGSVAGAQQVTATVGTITQTFTLIVTIPVSGIQKLPGGDGQVAVVNTAFGSQLKVLVVNAQGNPVQGAPVSFAVTSGSATVSPAATTTAADGTAATTVQAGANPGPITVTATSNGFSVSFSLTSRLPGPTNVAFVNGASFQPGIAPGAIVTMTGTGIATGVQGLVTSGTVLGPQPTTLSGISVTFNGTAAPIFSVSNIGGKEQVTLQVPFEVAPGTASVTINAAGGGSATISNVVIQSLSPGVFQAPGAGNFAVIVRPDGSFVNQNNPLRRGEVGRMYATGLGQVGPTPTSTNRAGVPNQDVLASIVVGVNNNGVPFISARTMPGLVGVYEVMFQVPADTATGPSQPLGLIVTDANGNTFTAQGTSTPIQ